MFEGLVGDLFGAAPRREADRVAGTFDGIEYHHVEARCRANPVARAMVLDVADRNGTSGATLAIVVGVAGFSAAAIDFAFELDVHLFEVHRSLTGYESKRVA